MTAAESGDRGHGSKKTTRMASVRLWNRIHRKQQHNTVCDAIRFGFARCTILREPARTKVGF